jgi:FkbM family methyltransferase
MNFKALPGEFQRLIEQVRNYSNKKNIILRYLRQKKDPFRVKIQDKEFFVRKSRGDFAVLKEIYRRKDYEEFDLENYQVMIDVGGHIGAFSVKYSDHADKIISYEPNPSTFSLLEKNLYINEVNNVVPLNKALSHRKGEIELYSNSTSLRSSTKIKESNTSTKNVKTESLKHSLEKIDSKENTLLKLDCEGAEFDIIGKTDKETLKKLDAIFIEWHGKAGNPNKLIERLRSVGFKIKSTKDLRNIQNDVGFIYAEFNSE